MGTAMKVNMTTKSRAARRELTPARMDRGESLRRVLPVSSSDCPVVGLGASAGGLEAFSKLLDVLPPDSGMTFILIQHLAPTHESLMVDLRSRHTAMKVQHATDRMLIERDHVYVIPPRAYISIREGALRLSAPKGPH